MVDRSGAPTGLVTDAEVRGWFKAHRGPWPDDTHCAAIADLLNRIAGRTTASVPSAGSIRQIEWWDFAKAATAARTLLDAVPAMRVHWNGLEWTPETAGGTAAIDALEIALRAALPRIERPFEWPFALEIARCGVVRRAGDHKARRRTTPKTWHLPAVLIARPILAALRDAGHRRPALSRNSVAVSVLRQALLRAGIPRPHRWSTAAIAAQLARWQLRFGTLTPA